ncbi:hypothetical protein ONZ45_g19054 [Pleurotus djamor]|nr:hypothetical protein ONZ45_g19054 [Pleurotus djamor]
MSGPSRTNESRRNERPVLPPIRDLFGEELSVPSRGSSQEPPYLTLAQLSVRDDDDRPHRRSHRQHKYTHSSVLMIIHSFRLTNIISTLLGIRVTSSRKPCLPVPTGLIRLNRLMSLVPLTPSNKGLSIVVFQGHYATHTSSSMRGTEATHHEAHPSWGVPTYRAGTPQPHHPSPGHQIPRPRTTVQTNIVRHHLHDDDDRTPTGRHGAGTSAAYGQEYSHQPSTEEDGHEGGSASKYECSYCGKGFNRPSSLKIHLNSHTGEKPFTCPVEGCGRSFSVLSNMRRHTRVHSQSTLSEGDTESIGLHPNPAAALSAHYTETPTSYDSHQHHRRASSVSSSASSRRSRSPTPNDAKAEKARPEKRSRHQYPK